MHKHHLLTYVDSPGDVLYNRRFLFSYLLP